MLPMPTRKEVSNLNKQELKTICDDLADGIINESTKEEILKRMNVFSENGKTISNAGMAMYCITESQEFTKKLVYSVLCAALDL
jgi:hypothetical protein